MFDPEQITFFAKTDARGQRIPFGIKAKDRTKHIYVIGKTGMGKSTLLENMAVQDIKNGNGLAFIDPHGATAETLLEYIPEERKQDVLYFAPFDTDHPVSFNVMEDVGPDKRHLVVAGLMSVFKKIWVDAWSSRMEYILSNTLAALLEFPDATLLGVNRMLSDKHYRKKVVSNITDPAVRSFWVDEFANYNERYMQEAGDAIKNKIGQFTSNPLIRNIVGQPHSSFDLREIMDGRKILIANLSKGLVGESNANLLGSMLTTRIYLAAMSRADLSAQQLKDMPNFYFYVDEFQSFANATFADILSEARKYKLNLTIAHQYIEQMEEEVRNAVFGNVGTIIAFRVGPFDAEVLETIFTPKFLAADIVNLGFAQIYLTLMIDGIGSQPFSATTLPPIEPPQVSCKDMVIATSRARYTKERRGVEDRINEWHDQSYDEKKLEYEARKKAMVEEGKRGNELSQQQSGSRQDNQYNNDQQSAHNGKSRDGNSNYNGKNNRALKGKGKGQGTPDRPQRDNGNRSRQNGNNNNRENNDSEKNVEELRSILKNLVASTDKKDSNRDSSPDKKVSTPANKEELQAVLKNAGLATADRSSATPPQVVSSQSATADRNITDQQKDTRQSTQQSSSEASRKQQTSRRSHQTTENIHRPEVASAEKQPSTTEVPTPQKKQFHADAGAFSNHVSSSPTTASLPRRDDPLAPEKLQQMMRVTGSDRPPFK